MHSISEPGWTLQNSMNFSCIVQVKALPQFPFMWNKNSPVALTRVLEWVPEPCTTFLHTTSTNINKYISITQNCVLFFPLPIQTFKIHEDSRGGNGGRRGNQIFRPLDLTIFPVYNNWDLSCFKEKNKAHSVLNLLWWNGICIQHPSPVVRGNHCLHRRLCTLNPLLVQLLYIWF